MMNVSDTGNCAFEAFITNLGKYNEGFLVGEWVKFPVTNEEMQAVFRRIGIGRRYEEYAIGYGLIKRQQNAKYKLTDRGKQLAEQIKAVGDLMVIEIGDLNLLAKKLTERKVEEIVDRWRIKDAENQ